MINTKVSAGIAEKQYNHYNWPSDSPDPPKRNYFVPHFGEDPDITATKSNLAATEKAQGHKLSVSEDGDGSFSTFVQTDSDLKMESDPICSSAGCTQYPHPSKDRGYKIDYFVPNFGAD
jgi:hypothetical protein